MSEWHLSTGQPRLVRLTPIEFPTPKKERRGPRTEDDADVTQKGRLYLVEAARPKSPQLPVFFALRLTGSVFRFLGSLDSCSSLFVTQNILALTFLTLLIFPRTFQRETQRCIPCRRQPRGCVRVSRRPETRPDR